MPSDDVSDLRDVVDAINRLCETMKTSEYESEQDVGEVLVNPDEVVVNEVETYVAELWSDASSMLAEETSESCELRAQVEETVVLDSYIVRDEVVTAVASNQPLNVIKDVEDSSSDQLQVTNVENVVLKSSIISVDNVETVPSNPYLTQVVNLDTVASNRTITQVENVDTYKPITAVENVETCKSITRVETVENCKSITHVENVESVASDPSPTKIEDIRTAVSDPENLTSCEPVSEMYYTASSEVSLLSDLELPERIPQEESVTRDDRNGVMAGHVAAMRERFESMTRTNTPCPDLARSVSPSLDVYRNITPSPDNLG